MTGPALLIWFRDHGRPLPWRGNTDPWSILVAEVMSQQTQLSRVVPAWRRFMERFPEPASLADADTAELIDMWAGMGYQRRALNLRRAAVVIAGNGWPTTAAGLRLLPGVGSYTAAAVACFAFGEPVPAVDTNLRRVLSRWEGTPLTGDALEEAARLWIDPERPADWNQAVMDLAATLCRPANPRCGECPVSAWCVDPAVYVAPPRQTRYEGSVRQARAAIMKALIAGPAPIEELPRRVGIEPERVGRAIAALEREGAVVRMGATLTLGE